MQEWLRITPDEGPGAMKHGATEQTESGEIGDKGSK
jgi:hypothetical protein